MKETSGNHQATLQERVARQDTLLAELTHRFSNTLMILATLLAAKARAARDDESRALLMGLHHQILCITAVQQVLQPPADAQEVAVRPYLARLCSKLAASTAGAGPAVTIRVRASNATARAADMFSLGLVVTELVTNAVKHAFPDHRPDRRIAVTYRTSAGGWRLTVSDNGIGDAGEGQGPAPRLGVYIVDAIAKQLHAQVQVDVTDGRRTTLSHSAARGTAAHAALPDVTRSARSHVAWQRGTPHGRAARRGSMAAARQRHTRGHASRTAA